MCGQVSKKEKYNICLPFSLILGGRKQEILILFSCFLLFLEFSLLSYES